MIDFGSIVKYKGPFTVTPIIGNTHQIIGFLGKEVVLITNVKQGHDGFPHDGDILEDRFGNILDVDLRDGRRDLYYVRSEDLELCENDSIRVDRLTISIQYNAKSRR